MSGLIFAELGHLGLLKFTGEDARRFLHAQLSCDVEALAPGQATYGSYNTAKGRMLASFLLWRDGSDFMMQLPRELCESIRKRLSMYILRSKVKAVEASDECILFGLSGARWEAVLNPSFKNIPGKPLTFVTDNGTSLLRLDRQRFEIIAPRARAYEVRAALSAHAAPVPASSWDWTNIRAGVPSITPATQEQFVPQMANLDLIGGVSFSKGCYPGQEIVARMHYRGRLKQRMYLAHIANAGPPQPGDKLYSADHGDQASGMIVNAAPSPAGGHDVLAVIQIDSASHGGVRWRSSDGPVLEFLDLPYKTEIATADDSRGD